jgi:hypothetical protein
MAAGIVIATTLVAAPAVADESADAARATAVAACTERPKAKKVAVAVKVDGTTTNHRYTCSEILAGTEVPAPSDFEVGIDVLKKQCFASAGCSIAYRINAKYDGSTPLDPSKVYTVVYDVSGAESPITANFTVRGTKVDGQRGTAYLPRKDAKLDATVTSVFEGS